MCFARILNLNCHVVALFAMTTGSPAMSLSILYSLFPIHCSLKTKKPTLSSGPMLALPIFPVRSKYRFAGRNMPVACCRQSDTGVQKSPFFRTGLCWRYLFSRPVTRQVSSAQVSLTSVFGMGTGGPSPQSTPTLFPNKIRSTVFVRYRRVKDAARNRNIP